MSHRHHHHNQHHQEREKRRQEMLQRLEALENQDKTFGNKFAELDNHLNVIDQKLEQLPIISETLQHYANAIAEGAAENKLLNEKLNKLHDRLDSYNKFVCSSLDPDNLQGQAKEMHGLLCLTAGHDEL